MIRYFLFSILFMSNIAAQDFQTAWDLYNSYEIYKEKSLTNRRFKHTDIQKLIEQLKNKNNFTINKVG